MGINKMTGTPFQIIKLPNPEGRRHRSKCIYYRKDGASDYCGYRFGRCMGSAHCDFYREKNQIEKKSTITNTSNVKKDQTTSKQIPMPKEVLIGEKILSPQGNIGTIVDVQNKTLSIKIGDETVHIGFLALKNPPIGRWKAVDNDIQLFILHLLENQ